eukprot:318684_1
MPLPKRKRTVSEGEEQDERSPSDESEDEGQNDAEDGNLVERSSKSQRISKNIMGGENERSTRKRAAAHSIPDSKKDRAELQSIGDERRKLRSLLCDQRENIDRDAEALANPEDGAFLRLAGIQDKILPKITHSREFAMDAENQRRLCMHALKQRECMGDAFNSVSAPELISALKERSGNGPFKWNLLGLALGVCHAWCPRVTVMLGPLNRPPKEKVVRKVRKKDKDNSTAERELKEADMGDVDESAKDSTVLRLEKLKEVLSTAHAQAVERGSKMDFFKLLLNPQSFTQTVENLFDFCFFIKNGESMVELNEKTGLPHIIACLPERDKPECRQMVLNFTMQDWKNLVEAYGMENSSPMIAPRRDDVYYDPLIECTSSAVTAQDDNI